MKKVKAEANVSAKSLARKKTGPSPKVSRSGGDNFPVVCLGGSAGSLKAYTAVIREIPPDAGMAVVVVSHLRRAPTNLPQILARHTAMPVDLIASGLKLRPNRVYVIPPGRELTVRGGVFHLSPLAEKRGWPTVITVFLESLARQWNGKTIAVILSGLDSDGVKALPTIKAAGGITFAQKIETAEQQSMPRQAVETGFVDFELTPVEIGRELARIAREQGPGASKLAENLPKATPPAESKATDSPDFSDFPGFPIVGVGASAGGLEAFTQLLDHLPAHTGMAFVLVQHLDPTHESQLTEILSRKSAMPVAEVSGPTHVEADHVYVIPAGKNLTIANGILQTVPRPETGARNMPIDDFLEALGKDRQNGAFAVILSGTASDGTLGARAIKAEGGITFAQEPSSAKFDGMPRSAIASGAVDFVLTPEGIAKQLRELAGHSYPHAVREQVSSSATTDARDLNRIFVRLRAATAIDFTYYKHNTILQSCLTQDEPEGNACF